MGVVEGGPGWGDERSRVSTSCLSLRISHYPPGLLTRDFYKGRFKSSKEKRPDPSLLEHGLSSWTPQSDDFLWRIIYQCAEGITPFK